MFAFWIGCALVLGWVPMLVALRRPGPRGAERRGPAEPGPVLPLDRILVLLTYLTCAALTALAVWSATRQPGIVRQIAGVALFWTGIGLWLWGRAAVGEHFAQAARAPSSLVTRGPFRLVRHPLYLATTIATFGQALASRSAWGVAVWILVVAIFAWRARREERLLHAAFGAAWEDYARRTPRLLP